jgi:hypothetical protein
MPDTVVAIVGGEGRAPGCLSLSDPSQVWLKGKGSNMQLLDVGVPPLPRGEWFVLRMVAGITGVFGV